MISGNTQKRAGWLFLGKTHLKTIVVTQNHPTNQPYSLIRPPGEKSDFPLFLRLKTCQNRGNSLIFEDVPVACGIPPLPRCLRVTYSR